MRNAVLVAVTIALTGCGIDRGGAPQGGPVPGPVDTDTWIAGPIADISTAALTIDDTVISTSSASIEVDEAASALDLLQIGQYAVVRGLSDTATSTAADSVTIATEVIGSAAAFDAQSNALTVLGQRVVISDDTAFDAALSTTDFDDLTTLAPLRISGIVDGLGSVYASYIAPEATAPSRLTGFARMVNQTTRQFQIGDQSVSYGNAMVIELPGMAPEENARVTVTGVLDGAQFVADTVAAAPLIPPTLQVNALVSLTAAVTRPLAGNSFAAGFVEATLNTDATITNGTTAQIVAGAVITVDGRWTQDQTIAVETVRIVRAPSQLVAGQ